MASGSRWINFIRHPVIDADARAVGECDTPATGSVASPARVLSRSCSCRRVQPPCGHRGRSVGERRAQAFAENAVSLGLFDAARERRHAIRAAVLVALASVRACERARGHRTCRLAQAIFAHRRSGDERLCVGQLPFLTDLIQGNPLMLDWDGQHDAGGSTGWRCIVGRGRHRSVEPASSRRLHPRFLRWRRPPPGRRRRDVRSGRSSRRIRRDISELTPSRRISVARPSHEVTTRRNLAAS